MSTEISVLSMILKSIDQITDEEKPDMFFIDFGQFLFDCDEQLRSKRREDHHDWFAAKGLRHAPAAPRGWLEGDPGLYAVHLAGPDDPRVAEYTARFENADGSSLEPEVYQMNLLPYQSWLDHGGPDRLARDLADDD